MTDASTLPPSAPPVMGAGELSPPDPLDMMGNRVLIVDDDPLIGKMLKKGLERYGYLVEVAPTGYEAGFLTVDFEPDCLLLDINLPDIDGDIVCRRVRESENTALLKIIGISATSDATRIQAMHEAGIDAFIPKPFSVEAIRAKILELVGDIRPRPPEPQPQRPSTRKWVLLAGVCLVVALAAAYSAFTVEPEIQERHVEVTKTIADSGEKVRLFRGQVVPESKMQAILKKEEIERKGLAWDEESHRYVTRHELEDRRKARERAQQEAESRLIGKTRTLSDAPDAALGSAELVQSGYLKPFGGRLLSQEEIEWWQTETSMRRQGLQFFEGRWWPHQQMKTWAEVAVEDGKKALGFVFLTTERTLILTTPQGQRVLPGDTPWQSGNPAPYQAYWDRASALGVGTYQAENHYQTALWCRDKGFPAAAEREFRLTLIDDRSHQGARQALGYQLGGDGRWIR